MMAQMARPSVHFRETSVFLTQHGIIRRQSPITGGGWGSSFPGP